MTTRTSKTAAQLPATQAQRALPRQLGVGAATLHIEAKPISERFNPDRTIRFNARWTHGKAEGAAVVELRPTSKVTTGIAVQLQGAAGTRKLLWGPARRRAVAGLFADALGYILETRGDEEASAFEIRRTSPALVKARSA